MVRTRQMGCGDDALATSESLSCNIGRRKDCRISGNVDEGDESSDPEIVISNAKRRKYPLRSGPPLKHADSPKSLRPFGEHVGKRSRVKREILGEVELRSGKENSNINVDTNSNGIRRSTRQRKFMYDTLNQGWLLGSARMRDFSALIDDDLEERRIRRGKGSKKNEKDSSDDDDDDDDGDDDDSEPVYEDMYSRIKMERRKTVRNYYNLKSKRRRLHSDEDETNESIQYEIGEEQELGNSRGSSVDEEEETNESSRHSKYYLRQKKPIIDRFQVPVEPPRHRKTSTSIFCAKSPQALICNGSRNFHGSFRSPAHKSPVFKHKRLHATHNSSTSSCSSSSEDERRFEKRKAKSMTKARNRCLPMNYTEDDVANCGVLKSRIKIGSSLADVDPMAIDRNVTFDCVGGLSDHIQSLKEMLLLPLMYPEVFDKFKITPPRGVLFYGAPGTGKTLVARALANECSQGDQRKVAFFMRKGADCLSKWVGESERQLRLLFDQAYSMRPSIIFFDEIDGLAPVRSTRQDQIHSSIVSTLLALMDGLDSRGEVVIIGATNRIDAIDPALRRPGRFDREFNFPLPSFEARKLIIGIHTKEWKPPLAEGFIEFLAEKSVGYCGADIKALCSEAAFLALRRQFPEIYHSRQKLQLDVSSIKIEAKDFYKALYKIVPASQRSAISPGRPLSTVVQPLLQSLLNAVLEALKITFPQGSKTISCNNSLKDGVNNLAAVDGDLDFSSDDGSNLDDPSSEINNQSTGNDCDNQTELSTHHFNLKGIRGLPSHRPRLLITGLPGQGQSSHIAPAVLHYLEKFPVHKIDLPSLFAVTTKSPEECCAQIFLEAQRVLPSVLYLPHIGQWYETLSDTVRATFFTLLDDLDPTSPLLLLVTSDCSFEELPSQVQQLFNNCHGEVISMTNPGKDQRRLFFSDLILKETKKLPKRKQSLPKRRVPLPVAPQPPPRTLSASDIMKLEQEEEGTLRELRIFLREVLYKLARDRRFVIFTKPVDTSEVSDYLQVIRHPMDLETMMTKIDLHKYLCVGDFLTDIDLICHNALEYNPDRDPSDKLIRHRACALKDTAHAFVVSELDPEFEQMCQEIRDSRLKRNCAPSKYAPKNYVTIQKKIEDKSSNPSKDFVNKASDSTVLTRELQDPVAPSEVHLQRNQSDDIENVPLIKGQGNTHGSSPFLRRRKPSFWFGCHRRRIVSRTSKEHSSDEYQDSVVIKKNTAAEVDSLSTNVNEELNLFSDEESKELTVGRKTTKVKIMAGENGVIKVNGLHDSKVMVDPLLTVPYLDTFRAVKDTHDLRGNHVVVKEHENMGDSNNCGEKNTTETAGKDLQMGTTKSFEEVEDISIVADGGAVVKVEMDVEDNDSRIAADERKSECSISDDCSRKPKEVIISEIRLLSLLEKVVAYTRGFTVETLERLHCHLCKCISAHRQEWDRTALVGELEKEVEKCSRRMAKN